MPRAPLLGAGWHTEQQAGSNQKQRQKSVPHSCPLDPPLKPCREPSSPALHVFSIQSEPQRGRPQDPPPGSYGPASGDRKRTSACRAQISTREGPVCMPHSTGRVCVPLGHRYGARERLGAREKARGRTKGRDRVAPSTLACGNPGPHPDPTATLALCGHTSLAVDSDRPLVRVGVGGAFTAPAHAEPVRAHMECGSGVTETRPQGWARTQADPTRGKERPCPVVPFGAQPPPHRSGCPVRPHTRRTPDFGIVGQRTPRPCKNVEIENSPSGWAITGGPRFRLTEGRRWTLRADIFPQAPW